MALLCFGAFLFAALAVAAPPAVIVAEARLDRFVDRVEALGTLRANESVSLTASVTETVTAIHFDDGQRVEAGEVLVEMTSAEEHALLEEAQALVEEARSQYQRVHSLAAEGTAAQSLLDERRREWETARARAYGERSFSGEVKSIDSRVDPVTRSILVRALLPNPDQALKPGMLMTVELLKNPRQALVIPEEALIPEGQKQYVLVVNEARENRVERREVRIGARRPGEVEILEGLAPGEKVITHGTLTARPGQTVAIRAVDDGSQSLREMLESTP